MRQPPAYTLTRRLGLIGAMGLLSLMSACANTSMRPAATMALGVQAPAPMGYLEFCARRPEQCGLGQVADANGAPIQAELRAQDLRRRYYWAIALAGAAGPQPRLTPASGETSPVRPTSFSGAIAAPSVLTATPPILPARPSGAAAGVGAFLDRSLWAGDTGSLRRPALLMAPPPQIVPTAPESAPATTPGAAQSAPPADPFTAPDPDADTRRAVQPIAATPAAMTMLNGVNRGVNQAIRYVPARTLYGADDYWTLPLEAGGLRAGDCKDYVLEKRKALVEQGVPMADLSIAVVLLRNGAAHAVLLVATDRGELVMDSLSPWITPWSDLDYRWISRQAPGQQLVWVKVGPAGQG